MAASKQEAAPELAQGSTDIGSPAPEPEPEQSATAAKPEAEAPKADAPNADAPEADAPKADAAADAPDSDAAGTDAPRIPGKVVIMSSGDHGTSSAPEAGESQGMFGKRRIAALAAVVALAVVAGAVGGALATAALMHVAGGDAVASSHQALEPSVARIDGDVLKSSLEHASKIGMSQFNKTSERLDKLEKAQAEPAAKLAKLSEAVDKLRATAAATPMPVAAVPAVAKEATGSVSPPAEAAPATAPKAEAARLPTIEGWVLRDVGRGGALIDGRRGIYEVYAGDFVPGLGRVDAIRRQDGRWVVVTSKGLIVAR
jgi:hypothetical protein